MRKISFVLALLLISGCLISCTNDAKYSVLEVGENCYSSEAKHSSEIDLTEKRTENLIKINTEIPYEVYGTQYLLPYIDTATVPYYFADVDYYRILEDGFYLEVGTNPKTGRVDFFSWYDPEYLGSITSEKLNRDECLEIATKYLSGYIEDLNDYTLINEKYRQMPIYDGFYDFKFARIVEGVETLDCAEVSVTVYGTITSHRLLCTGDMKDVQIISLADFAVAEENVEKKLNEIYSSVNKDKNIVYDIGEPLLVRLKDGKYALEYRVGVKIHANTDNGIVVSELTHLLVYLE